MSGCRATVEVRTGTAICQTCVETDRVPYCKPALGVGAVAGRAIMKCNSKIEQILLTTGRKVLDYNEH